MSCRPGGRMSAASNFHIKASRVRTGEIVVRTANLMQAISISDARASGPWWLASGHLDLNCDTSLLDERIRMGINVVWTIAAIFPYLCLARNPEACSNTEDRTDGLLNQTVWHVVRTADALDSWASKRYDTSSGRLAGNQIFWLENCAKSSKNTSE